MSYDYKELLAFASELARQTRPIMLESYEAADKQVAAKSNSTPVTIADTSINQLVIDSVNQRYPQHGVLGEEDSVRTEANELWVCDPLDGTRGFVVGELTSMFSLAFVVDGKPVLAVAYSAFIDRLYTAVKGGGAACNGQPITVSRRAIGEASIAGTASLKGLSVQLPLLETLQARGAAIPLISGNVFRSSLVAEGRIEGHVFPGRGAHDIAAMQLIVEEAGGKVTDLDGHEQRYDRPIRGAVISNGVVHDDLLAAVRDYGVEDYLGY